MTVYTTEIDAFMSRVGSSSLLSVRHASLLEWSNKSFSDSDHEVLAMLCASGILSSATTLELSLNKLDNDDVTAFLDACAGGALESVATLDLSLNKIGDDGVKAILHAGARKALPQLVHLDLDNNSIGDTGAMAISAACARGGPLVRLRTLYLGGNRISGTVKNTVRAAVSKNGGSVIF